MAPQCSPPSIPAEEIAVRKSVSYSNFEKDNQLPNQLHSSNRFHDDDDTIVFSGDYHRFLITSWLTPYLVIAPPVLRGLSPGPLISADLSTILEADTSKMSQHILSSSNSPPPRSPALSAIPPPLPLPIILFPGARKIESERGCDKEMDQGAEADTSVFDFSTTHLTNQVLDALLAKDSNTASEWLNADKAVIVDADDPRPSDLSPPPPHKRGSSGLAAAQSFNLGALDPDLAVLLSPNRLLNANANAKLRSMVPQPSKDRHSPVINLSQYSPVSVDFITLGFEYWIHTVIFVSDVPASQCIISKLP